jgi:hypothetical protein
MELITAEERRRLIDGATREAAHLEMRDNYGGDRHLFDRWQAGDHDLAFMNGWCERVRAGIAKGKGYRRACVVSEPLSDYQCWAYAVSGPQVEAGEDLRWVPRRLLSAVALPGNDFWLLDGEIVTFGIFSGADERVEIQLCTEPDVVKFCRDSFEAVWALSISHREYHPA